MKPVQIISPGLVGRVGPKAAPVSFRSKHWPSTGALGLGTELWGEVSSQPPGLTCLRALSGKLVSSRASLDSRCLPIRLALPPGWLLGKWLKGRGASWAFSASASPSQGSSGNSVLRLRLLQQQMTNRTGENCLPWRRHWESRGNPPGSGKLDDGEPLKPPPSWPGSSASL